VKELLIFGTGDDPMANLKMTMLGGGARSLSAPSSANVNEKESRWQK
jgi:hypothetical protein